MEIELNVKVKKKRGGQPKEILKDKQLKVRLTTEKHTKLKEYVKDRKITISKLIDAMIDQPEIMNFIITKEQENERDNK